MPVLDGLSVLAEMRTSLPQPWPRVIVMTAHGSVRTAIHAVRSARPISSKNLSVPMNCGKASPASWTMRRMPTRTGKMVLPTCCGRCGKRCGVESFTPPRRPSPKRPPSATTIHTISTWLACCMKRTAGRWWPEIYIKKPPPSIQNCAAALQNLNRLDQIEEYGSTLIEVALGDETAGSTRQNDDADSPGNRLRRMLDMKFGDQPGDDGPQATK